ncbi:FimV family protein, partial [Hydrogenophaga sp.]|uniref:type IV pilus assembly protein FimV n=1 Tax=Hydrogenophaga sp. TaxID=1904254 RepID=UPI00356A9C24
MRQIWIGCILLSIAWSGSAATLGRHSGAAVIGRPLDIRVQLLTAPGEDVSAVCMEADVFYGDSQVLPGAVRSAVQKTAPDAQSSVRIQSSQVVNEPIVTVYVRAGCNAPFTRRYVLLADPISEATTAPAQFPARASSGVVPSAVPVVPNIPASNLPPAQRGSDVGSSRDDNASSSSGASAVKAPTAVATPPRRKSGDAGGRVNLGPGYVGPLPRRKQGSHRYQT